MGLLFKNDLHDEFGGWAFGYMPYGGADFGEVAAIAEAVGDGDDGAYHEAWVSAAGRLAAEAEAALGHGHRGSARALYLRASAFYALSYHPLYGAPVDPRLLAAFRAQIGAFERGLSLFDPPVEPMRIPFEGKTIAAYLIPAAGKPKARGPLIIMTGGYDSSVTDTYFASAVAASERGYHCLLFDGPGQGAMLIEQGQPLRPDWESVIRPVVDAAVALPIVDLGRIALSGWSLGGYLALRAASGEKRLAACIADPGLFGMSAGFEKFALALGVPASAAGDLAGLDAATLATMEGVIAKDAKLTWGVIKRGYWVQGVGTLRDLLRAAASYTLEGRVERIACPTLLTHAERDPLAASASAVYERLKCPKSLIRFSAAEGAGDHCEMRNRSLLNRRVLDWLDATLSHP